jgi:hypothetical protein
MILLSEDDHQPVAMLFGGPRNGPYATCTPLEALLDRINPVTGSQVSLQPPVGHVFQAKPYPADSVEHLSDLEIEMLEPEMQRDSVIKRMVREIGLSSDVCHQSLEPTVLHHCTFFMPMQHSYDVCILVIFPQHYHRSVRPSRDRC